MSEIKLQNTGKILDEAKRENWTEIITPKVHLLDIGLKNVWRYRDLMWLFVRRDFVAQYKQTILGPLWHVIQPLLTSLLFLFLFGRVARIGTDGIEPILFYLSGITIWNYFSACLTNTSTTFVTNAPIFGKVYFPRLVLPISIVISNIIRFGIQFSLLIIFMIYFDFKGIYTPVTLYWLLIPFIILVMAGISFGLGIIVSSLTTKYRDLSLLLTFAIQLGIYVAPVAFPYSYVENTKYKWVVEVNPLTSIIEAFRYCVFGKGTVTVGGLIYSVAFMCLAILCGTLIFNKVEKDFMDTV